MHMNEGENTAAYLKAEVLPRLFDDPNLINDYGQDPAAAARMAKLAEVSSGQAVSALTGKLGELVRLLQDASPQRLRRKHSWFGRFLGYDLQNAMTYMEAYKRIESLRPKLDAAASEAKKLLAVHEELLCEQAEEVKRLEVLVEAGKAYLAEHPEAGKGGSNGELVVNHPRDRFARKLTSMGTLIATQEMGLQQLQLARANIIDMIDRYHDAVDVLLPIWQNQSLLLTSAEQINPAVLAETTKAYDALTHGLSAMLSSRT